MEGEQQCGMDERTMTELMSRFEAMLNKTLDAKFEEKLKPIKDDVKVMGFEIQAMKKEIELLRKDNKEMKTKMRVSEDRSRAQNLRFGGIPVTATENCFDIVADFCKDVLGVTGVSINKAHRLTKLPDAQIIANLTFDGDVQCIMQAVREGKAKASGVFVSRDYSRETVEIRNALKPFIEPARKAGKKVILAKDSLIIDSQPFILGPGDQLILKQRGKAPRGTYASAVAGGSQGVAPV
jgi:uncharacterized protein (UPF0335 family)